MFIYFLHVAFLLFVFDTHLHFYDLSEPPRLFEIFLIRPSEFFTKHDYEYFVWNMTFASLGEYGIVVLYLAKKSDGSNAFLVTSLIALITTL